MGVDRPLEFMLEESIAKGEYENNRQNRQKTGVKKAERGGPDFEPMVLTNLKKIKKVVDRSETRLYTRIHKARALWFIQSAFLF